MSSKTFDQIREMITQDNVLGLAKCKEDIAAHRETVDINGRGLLHAAVHAKAGDALQWLLDYDKAEVDRADNQGETPLMRAAWLGYQPAVDMLLQAGASLKTVSLSGGTPLHFAYAGGTPAKQTVQALLDAGADADAVDHSGNPAADWKRQADQREAGEKMLAASKAKKRLTLSKRTP